MCQQTFLFDSQKESDMSLFHNVFSYFSSRKEFRNFRGFSEKESTFVIQ